MTIESLPLLRHALQSRSAFTAEMQAASLFAFAQARGAAIAVVALVSNSVDGPAGGFDTGGNEYRIGVLTAIARAAARYLRQDTLRTS
jgi:uridine phosphorylase